MRAGRSAHDGFTNVKTAEHGHIYNRIDPHIHPYRPAYTSVKGGGGAGGRGEAGRETDPPPPFGKEAGRKYIGAPPSASTNKNRRIARIRAGTWG